jgi:hypothetical protein
METNIVQYMTPCSLVEALQERFASIFRTEEQTLLDACFAYHSTLGMEAVHFFGTSVNLHQTTGCHIAGDNILHCHHRENLRSHKYHPQRVLKAKSVSGLNTLHYMQVSEVINRLRE